jgi:hypothetical protein
LNEGAAGGDGFLCTAAQGDNRRQNPAIREDDASGG